MNTFTSTRSQLIADLLDSHLSFEAVREVGEADDIVGVAAAGFAHRKVRVVAAILPLAVELRSARGSLARLSGGFVQSADAHHVWLALHQLQQHRHQPWVGDEALQRWLVQDAAVLGGGVERALDSSAACLELCRPERRSEN